MIYYWQVPSGFQIRANEYLYDGWHGPHRSPPVSIPAAAITPPAVDAPLDPYDWHHFGQFVALDLAWPEQSSSCQVPFQLRSHSRSCGQFVSSNPPHRKRLIGFQWASQPDKLDLVDLVGSKDSIRGDLMESTTLLSLGIMRSICIFFLFIMQVATPIPIVSLPCISSSLAFLIGIHTTHSRLCSV